MSLYGRNDKATTANSSTTYESTTGMPIFAEQLLKAGKKTRVDGANAHFGNTSPGSRANVNINLFNNASPSVFINNQAIGVYGIDTGEIATLVSRGMAHAGWQLRRAGTGPIISVTASGGTTYNNTDVITVSSPVAGGNATASVLTNGSGVLQSATLTTPGFGFFVVSATANVTIANATGGASSGSGGSFTATAGGRAGRVHYETLVAFGSLGAQSAAYGTPASVSNSATQGTL
jgi:hypothetical protein